MFQSFIKNALATQEAQPFSENLTAKPQNTQISNQRTANHFNIQQLDRKHSQRNIFHQTKSKNTPNFVSNTKFAELDEYLNLCQKQLESHEKVIDDLFVEYFKDKSDLVLTKWKDEKDKDLAFIKNQTKLQQLSLKLKPNHKSVEYHKVINRLEEMFGIEECYEKNEVLEFIASGASWEKFRQLSVKDICTREEVDKALEASKNKFYIK